jgi:hypothetical protein
MEVQTHSKETKMSDDEVLDESPIARIDAAGAMWMKSVEQKRRALTQLYCVWLSGRRDPEVAAKIKAAYEARKSAEELPETKSLVAKILYLAASKERRRVSEYKSDFEAAKDEGVDGAGMYEWLVKRHQKPLASKSASPDTSTFKLLFGYAKKLSKPENGHEVDASAVPVACNKGEYILQVLQPIAGGGYLSSWVVVSESGVPTPVSVAPDLATKSLPLGDEDLVTRAAERV